MKVVACKDLVPYENEQEIALLKSTASWLSIKTRENIRAVHCPACKKWHLLFPGEAIKEAL